MGFLAGSLWIFLKAILSSVKFGLKFPGRGGGCTDLELGGKGNLDSPLPCAHFLCVGLNYTMHSEHPVLSNKWLSYEKSIKSMFVWKLKKPAPPEEARKARV